MGKEKFSNQVNWYNFILCIFVVLIHAQNTEFFTGGIAAGEVSILNQIEWTFSSKIAVAGVAGFFLCSGYLFYRNYSWQNALEKYKSRFRGVFIPYVLWTLGYYLLHVIVSYISPLQTIFNETRIIVSWNGIIDAVLNYRYCSFMWFLQFLILFVILSPLIFMLIKNRCIGLISILLILFVDASGICGDSTIGNVQIQAFLNWLFIYMTGGYIGIHSKGFLESNEINWKLTGGSGILCMVAYCFWEYMPCMLSNLLYFLSFAVALWCFVSKLTLPKVAEWQKHTFMVYMTHFLVVRALNIFISKYVSSSVYVGFLMFLLLPMICFMMVWLLWRLMGRGKCFLWTVMSGNR